jgi:hypothetical protein
MIQCKKCDQWTRDLSLHECPPAEESCVKHIGVLPPLSKDNARALEALKTIEEWVSKACSVSLGCIGRQEELP